MFSSAKVTESFSSFVTACEHISNVFVLANSSFGSPEAIHPLVYPLATAILAVCKALQDLCPPHPPSCYYHLFRKDLLILSDPDDQPVHGSLTIGEHSSLSFSKSRWTLKRSLLIGCQLDQITLCICHHKQLVNWLYG